MIGLRELTKMRVVVDLEKRRVLLFEDCLKRGRGVGGVVEELGGVEELGLCLKSGRRACLYFSLCLINT